MESTVLFSLIILVVAFFYASVGHGGASGYLAVLALAGYSAGEMKSSALLLNILVSAIAFIQYYRQGYFRMHLLWPFAVTSIPFAFVGAHIPLQDHLYKIILAVCLVFAVARLLGIFGRSDKSGDLRRLHLPSALLIGALIGFISGMIGIGGGILLSPLLLLLRWADMKQAASISAGFIFLNSIAGLAGTFSSGPEISSSIYGWIIAAVIGGIAGAYSGSRKFDTAFLKYVLSSVLLFACVKLIIT